MNGEEVRVCEEQLEAAIRRAVSRLVQQRHLRKPPPPGICHLMAKAAVAVLEATAEPPRRPARRPAAPKQG